MADELDTLMAEATSLAESCSTTIEQAAEADSVEAGEVVEAALDEVEQQLAGLEAAFEEPNSEAEPLPEGASAVEEPESAGAETGVAADQGEAETDEVESATETELAAEPTFVEADASATEAGTLTASTGETPRSAPKEWIEEAGVGGAAPAGPAVSSESALPDISEEGVQGAESVESLGATKSRVPAGPADQARGLRRVASLLVGIPLMLLRTVDIPFAGLSMSTKTFIGRLAIGTLVVAIATWVAGSYNILRP